MEGMFGNLAGIEIIQSPHVPRGHFLIKDGNELFLVFPRASKSFMMLNNLAPTYFNETDAFSYELKPIGKVGLKPVYEMDIPQIHFEPKSVRQ